MSDELDYFHVTRKRGRLSELDEARPRYAATVHAELAISSPMVDAVIVERCVGDGCRLCSICRAESSLPSRARRRVAEDRHKRQRREVPR